MFVNVNNIPQNVRNSIEDYYKEKGEIPLYPSNIFSYIGNVLTANEKQVIVLNNRLLCGGTKAVFKKKCEFMQTVTDFSVQYKALKEALAILNRRGVACFFFNRPGTKKQYSYEERALYRRKHKLNFPKMLRNIEKYDEDWKQLIGEDYSTEYVRELSKIPQIIKKDNVFVHEDFKSKLVNVRNGKRITCKQPENPKRHVYVYGRCGAFGYAVADHENIPSYLQELFIENDMADCAVINQGLWGATDSNILHNFLFQVSEFREGDIVIFYLKHFDFKILEKLEKEGLWFYNLTEPWHEFSEAGWCFYDRPGHMNRTGYKNAARLIFDYMKSKNFLPREKNAEGELSAKYLNEYLKNDKDTEFQQNIEHYLVSIKKDIPDKVLSADCGAIVMNCNPFTLGHRYLIEKACNEVDYLFIFVVEEDRSFFKFADRFKMVQDGTADLKNVFVVPSGKFIISALTFPEYFLKDYVKEKNFDVSNDVEIFCKYIAPAFNIKKRFVGEEPFDPVTNNYNCEMKKILPQYGMEFIEIPRAMTADGEIINATKVRKLLNEREYDILRKYLPESTMAILKRRYTKE